MSTQEAYINGFVKRAAQYGLNQYQAIELLKSAELKGNQYKLDVDHDGKIEAEDLAKLRAKKKITKSARALSEVAGLFNPLNLAATPISGIAAAVTPTRTDEEQAKAHEEGIENFLLPGRNTYNLYKRIGNATKGDLTAPAAESLSMLNPLNLIGGIAGTAGGIAAAVTDTRTEQEQFESDKEILKKLFMPGRSTYDHLKRLGVSNRKFDELLEKQKR